MWRSRGWCTNRVRATARWKALVARLLAGGTAATLGLLVAGPASAMSQSAHVIIVSSTQFTHGGFLVTDLGGPSPFDDFSFAEVPVGLVDAAHFGSADTIVLNVGSAGMGCTTASLTASQKSDVVSFVAAGGKLIIYDSGCPSVDYSWLPVPFTTIPLTTNPPSGQVACDQNAQNSLAIVEENTLSSSNPSSPYFVDTQVLSAQTSAVSGSNAMATYDLSWCLDMVGSRQAFDPGDVGMSGPDHAYVRYGAGLIIYNGLNQSSQTGNNVAASHLVSLWLQELQAAFDPAPLADLPCSQTGDGLGLAPFSAVNDVGSTHTVTATLTDAGGAARSGIGVTFMVTSGPNAGAVGTCNPASCDTDGNGQVTFTYASGGTTGTDALEACSTNASNQAICSTTVTKKWVITAPSAPTNVAFIESRYVQGGGTTPPQGGNLPISGGSFDAFSFVDHVTPDQIDPLALAQYGMVVLNMTSLGCDDSQLTTCQKASLVDWVSKGGKLIVYDSECPSIDYSWLPYPFHTHNPGYQRQSGTLKVVEENALSSNNSGSPHYIDAAALSAFAEVGDANVVVTSDPHWCVDMTAVNTAGDAGPVQIYARHGAGLMIYDGLDLDVLGTTCAPLQLLCDPPNGLAKIWLEQLQVAANPTPLADLPCGLTAVGIALTPLSATNEAGTSHTVDAALADLLGHPTTATPVSFQVVSGPNAGASGTCNPGDCHSDAEGHVTFTYTSNGQAGVDGIQACFTNGAGELICSQTVTKEWVITNHPPACDSGGPYAAECSGPSASVSLTGAASSDPDGDPLSFSWTSGCAGESFDDPTSVTPILTIDGGCAVTCAATLTLDDGHGHTPACQASVSIVDTTPPTITCPADLTVTCGDSTDPSVTGSAQGSDACHPSPTISSTDVVTDTTCPADPVDRRIARTWTATDACGLAASCVQTITVAKVQARIDIKPGSCPNGFNPQGGGTLPISITGQPGFDVTAIVPGSVLAMREDCSGTAVPPKRLTISDEATPFGGTACDCSTSLKDGIPDLSMSFAQSAITDGLQLGALAPGSVVPVAVSGRLVNGCGFVGVDCLAYVPGSH